MKHMSKNMYDAGFRQAVLRVYAKQLSIRKVARCFDLPPATVCRWVRRPEDSERKVRYPAQRLTVLTMQLVRSCAFTTCTEIAMSIRKKHGLCISRQRVSVLLRQLGFTRKRSRTRVIKDASPQQAEEHCCRFPLSIDASLLFAVDEMGVSEKTTPLYGYSQANTRVVHKRTSGSWKNISTVAVIGCDGSVHTQLSERSYNTDSFSAFLTSLDLPVGSHVILDNVAFHRSKSVADIFGSRGWTPLFIPPYQPDFNPIENVFSSVKHRVRQSVGRGEPVREAIARAFADASLPTTIKNCFKHMHDLVRLVRWPP